MKKVYIIIYMLIASLASLAQQQTINGMVLGEDGSALQSASVALLNPKDSTLAHFAITRNQGLFEITKIPNGEYLLQVAFIGYQTLYQNLKLPNPAGGDLGALVLKTKSIDVGEARVTAERVPILIKKDTVEYNAGAFKTKPDAVAEDLLRKLPGVEVDRQGNVKAMGENVNRVLVDGKEFFGNDPKVATKNLPAESIKKVQVYDKKSDESELLGLDNSEYDKTINFVLKDNMKKAVFGDVKAGGSVEQYYQGNAKVYRFTDKHQFAALGMLNNVNEVGFSVRDYFDFNGGMRSVMGGGGTFSIGGDNSIPVNFGQPVNGVVTSGAAGFNYSYELRKENRINVSYMGSLSSKELIQTSKSSNFTDTRTFDQNSNENGDTKSINHLLNIGWRNKASKKQNFMINGVATLVESNSNSNTSTESFLNSNYVNRYDYNSNSAANQLNTTIDGSWLRIINDKWRMFKTTANFRYNGTLSESDWRSITSSAINPIPFESKQYQNNKNNTLQYNAAITGLRTLGKGFYLEPSISTGSVNELFQRNQGLIGNPNTVVDSVSPLIDRQYQWIKPKLVLRSYFKKNKINVGVEYEMANQIHSLNQVEEKNYKFAAFKPLASWEYDYRTGRRISINYSSSVVLPTSSQLQPIISTSNPYAIYLGNRELEHEYRHTMYLSWLLFDQFSFTSVFANVSGSYTNNKIGRSITVADDLKQTISLINVPEDYTANASISFSTPIRPLGVKISLSGRETFNRTSSYINSIENLNTNFTHNARLAIDNRKKEKWDIEVGGQINYTDSRYSIQNQLNRTYFNYSAFGEIRYTPSQKFHFRVKADVTSYDPQSFGERVTIPLLSAEINYYFLASRRAMLTIEGIDLLNRNTGLSRVSDMNSLRETNANTIGRYIMLSFKYRLNKMGGESSGIVINAR